MHRRWCTREFWPSHSFWHSITGSDMPSAPAPHHFPPDPADTPLLLDWGTIWHQTQFGTGSNLAPDPIWHRTNLAPRVQKSQFGTGPNLAPESIWHHAKGIHFITLYSRNMKVICNKYNFAILRNLFESFFKSSLQVKPQDMYPPQILAIKVQYWKSCTQYPLQMFPPLLGPQGPPDTKTNSTLLKCWQ